MTDILNNIVKHMRVQEDVHGKNLSLVMHVDKLKNMYGEPKDSHLNTLLAFKRRAYSSEKHPDNSNLVQMHVQINRASNVYQGYAGKINIRKNVFRCLNTSHYAHL